MIERLAKNLCRPGFLYMSESTAVRDCHHFLTYRVHKGLDICCGCGRAVAWSYETAIIREAFD